MNLFFGFAVIQGQDNPAASEMREYQLILSLKRDGFTKCCSSYKLADRNLQILG